MLIERCAIGFLVKLSDAGWKLGEIVRRVVPFASAHVSECNGKIANIKQGI